MIVSPIPQLRFASSKPSIRLQPTSSSPQSLGFSTSECCPRHYVGHGPQRRPFPASLAHQLRPSPPPTSVGAPTPLPPPSLAMAPERSMLRPRHPRRHPGGGQRMGTAATGRRNRTIIPPFRIFPVSPQPSIGNRTVCVFMAASISMRLPK